MRYVNDDDDDDFHDDDHIYDDDYNDVLQHSTDNLGSPGEELKM